MSEAWTLERAAPPTPTNLLLRTAPTSDRFLLRGSQAVMTAAGAALGLRLPTAACRAATADGVAALWLGPDEELFIMPKDAGGAAIAAVSAALADQPHSLVDISHRQTGLDIRGPRADAMLSTGCPLDLHISQFPVDMCTRTVFAKAEIVLWRMEEEAFRIEVWRSFRAYVAGLLDEAGFEFDV